ncbi:protein sprouty homolog 1 [Gouania willdenowi]|uniref:Protein sprouty homolog 1 n=1 Tax=Gouania willdenowi TaxID=441366 RepID=A0A8C5GFI9_GOUWI|nr:protein sprouty homolog 1 [Gouania willdenowi]XP_028316258.1 protein sprouty homolog 1-like [Gouania willdenowi]
MSTVNVGSGDPPQMELQSQHGPGGSLVVIQQPSLESRQRSDYERELHQHAAAILSLDQIKAIRSSNEYTEGPSVVRRPPAPRMAPRPQEKQERTHEVILVNVNNNYEHRPSGHHHVVVMAGGQQHHYGGGRAPGLSRSTSTGSAASSGSNSSASSEQGLLARSPPVRPGVVSLQHQHRVERPVRTQPRAKSPLQPQQGPHLHHQPPIEAPLKPPQGKGKPDFSPVSASGHQFICERCGKCKCSECTAPRSLPSCLACNGQCLCSAESALEHGTCMCLVKGIFYHCSNDDEGDSCADQPCSLSRSHCCSRFLCMGLMSVLFPCLLCYPPVKGCLKACQRCYDRVNRPGCRCKNSNTVYCKLESWAQQNQEKPS